MSFGQPQGRLIVWFHRNRDASQNYGCRKLSFNTIEIDYQAFFILPEYEYVHKSSDFLFYLIDLIGRIRNIYSILVLKKISFYFDTAEFMKEEYQTSRQTQMKMQSLTYIFKENQVTQDVTRLKEAIAKGEDFQPILQEYRQQFSRKSMRIIESIVNSDIVKKMHEKDDKTEETEKVKRLKLDQLFAKNTNIKRDFDDLKNALMQNADITKIMQFYDEQLGRRELTAINNLLNSEELYNWKKKFDKDFKDYKQLEKITNIKKEELEPNKIKIKLDELFNHIIFKRFKRDFSKLKHALLMRNKIIQQEQVNHYSQIMPPAEYSQLLSILKSKSLQYILSGAEISPKKQAKLQQQKKQPKLGQQKNQAKLEQQIKKLFVDKNIQTIQYLDSMVNQLVNRKNIEQVRKKYQWKMPEDQFKIINDILNSKALKDLLNVSSSQKNDERQTKINKLENRFSHQGSKGSRASMQKQQILEQQMIYISKVNTGQSKQLKRISASIQDNQNFNLRQTKNRLKLNQFFKSQKINIDLNSFINAVIKKKDTSVIIQNIQEKVSQTIFKLFKKIIQGEQFKNLVVKFQQDIFREKLSKIFEREGFGVEIQPLKELILKKESTYQLINKYKQSIIGKDFKKLQNLINSQQIKNLVEQKNKKELISRLDTYFKAKGINKNIRPLIDLLIKNCNIEGLMDIYKNQMTGKDFNILNMAIESPQLQILLGNKQDFQPKQRSNSELTPQLQQKLAAVDIMLKEVVKSEIPQIFNLKMAIVQKRQYNQLLKTLSYKLSGKQYQNIQNLLKSDKFNLVLKKIEINQWKYKYNQLMGIIKGIQMNKHNLVESILLNMDYCNNILEDIIEKEAPDRIIEFNQSISSRQYHQFFVKHKMPQPIIKKKHVLYIQDKYYFINHETPLSIVRKKYQITDHYKFFNLKGEIITAQTIIEPMKIIKCTQFSAKFQGENKNIFLPSNITLKDSKPVIQKILNTNLQIEILILKNENLVQQAQDFILQRCSSKHLDISYYINLILTLNQDVQDKKFKSLSRKSVIEVKNEIFPLTGIKAQAQRWYIDSKQVLNNKETLESLGIKAEYFRITIIQLKSLQYYGFTKQIEIKRSDFKDFFIEDDKIFCQNIIKSKFPADEYSEVFRNQILGYIFAAIKKHSPIESSLNHIKSLVQSTGKEEDLWKPPSSKEKCYFNETFVLYYILRCSQMSLRIDLLRGVMSNVSVPLAFYNKSGIYVELMEQNYWIQNKAFTIVSFGHGDDVRGKSQLLNIIFETNFKNRDKMHKQCQGGIEIQYNIYKSDEYSVNLIDLSNEIDDKIKITLAKASNLVIVQTKKKEDQVINWIKEKLDVPVVVIFKDVQNAFEKENRHKRAEMKKNNDKDTTFNKFEIIPYPLNQIEFYGTQINEISNGVQQFIRKNYQKTTKESLWKFSDFLASHTNKDYVQFNNILKEIEQSRDNLTKISGFYNQYKILEAEIDGDNQENNTKTMDNIKKKAVQHGLAGPLKKIIRFYQQHFRLSSQIMCKIRLFLILLRNELFRQFNHLEQLLTDASKKKVQSEFQTVKNSIVDKLKNSKNLKDSLTTSEVKKQVEEFINKSHEFKSSKDWEPIIKKIKNQFEFQIQPKAFSIENFWREVIYLSKFDPKYEFTIKDETISLTDAIITLGKKEVHDSQNFEVINGDLLQMPTQYLHKIFEHQENKKIMVIAVIGPQSSGKSTLLNFVLGCDFMSSAGRCTKGIYGTYFQISNRQMPNCDAILVLDTQGLFSNYENKKFANRKGFDNKLVLFCLQVCDLIILNTKADVTKECQQILQAAYDSESLNEKNLPQLYFVLNINGNGGQMNATQYNQVEKFCDTVVATNPHAAKFVCKNHAAGMPMAFNEIPRKSTAQFVTKYLKPKTLPSQRFYKETKNLCYSIMDLISQRGLKRQGRTLHEVFVKMDQMWSTINKYPILARHGNKRIKLLHEKINQWKKNTKQNFINLLASFQQDLNKKKLSQIQNWSKEKYKTLCIQIQKAVQQFQTKFPITPGQLAINTCIKIASSEIQPMLNNSFQVFKHVIHAKQFQKQIQQSNSKGFHDINYLVKIIKQAQAQSKLISQKQKINKFEQVWNIRQKEMKKKIDRKAIAQDSYLTLLQMYNSQLQLDKKSKTKIQIQTNYLKDHYQDKILAFRQRLIFDFKSSIKNGNIFESSDKQPVMNIQKKQGDLSFKYLDMSKYFQNREKPTFIKIFINQLKECIDQSIILRQIQESLMKENLNQQFVNHLCDDFVKMGVKLNKNRVKQATQYKVSSRLIKWFSTSKKLTLADIDHLQLETAKQPQKDKKKGIAQKIVFNRICFYFVLKKEQLSAQDQIKKAQLLSNLKYISKIPNFQQLFSELIREQIKTINQYSTNRLIAMRLANKVIKQYANSLNKVAIDKKKIEIQNRIVNNIKKDLKSINLFMESTDIFNKDQISFKIINNGYDFKSLEQFKDLLSKFSKYWINQQQLTKSYFLKQDSQNTNKSIMTVGFFKRKEISVKKEYSDRPILQKYINKQYNEFLNEMKRSNFTQFVREELKYDSVFEDIYQFAVKQKLEKRDLNQAIQKIRVYTNQLVEDINNDLKQVSQTVRYCFMAELHFYSCHLLWKMREKNEWEKNENIIISFIEKKEQQLKKFLKLASGQPHLQNMACAQKLIELYVEQINKLIKADRQRLKKEQRIRFKTTYSRDYVQMKIDQELNDTSKPQKQLEEKIYKYLLTPVQYLRKKYEEYYTYAVDDLKKYKYSKHTNIIKDLLDSVIQFRDNTASEELSISDQVFQGQINENKEAYFLPLIVEVLRKKYAPYVGSENKLGLKIKMGKLFKIGKIMTQTENLDFLQTLLSQKILITNLKIFLDCFAKLLEDLRVSNKGICIDYSAGEISEFRLSLTVSVCSATCPCCKRNCDIDMDADPHHTRHKCSFGHQMRAIRGFRIESTQNNQIIHKASIQRCQDLENDSIFNFNGKDYIWSQFKNERKEWDFQFTDKNKNEAQLANYWKVAGSRICDFYVKEEGIPMQFLEYSKENIKKLLNPPVIIRPTNYIFALDESGSMSGNPWNELVKAIKSNISDISAINKAKNQYLSIFKFNEQTTQVCEFVEPQNFNSAQITFNSGGTCFTPAFKLGRQIIERHTNVDNVFVLISDGDAEQPTAEISKIQQLQAQATNAGRRVDYVSILIGGTSPLMEKIKTSLNGKHNNINNSASVATVFKQILKAKQ